MFCTFPSASWLGLCPLLWVISLWSAAKTCHGSESQPTPTPNPLLSGTANRLIPPKHCDALTYHGGALRSIGNESDRWAEPSRRNADHGWVSTGELAQLGQAHGRFCTLQRRRFAFGKLKRKERWQEVKLSQTVWYCSSVAEAEARTGAPKKPRGPRQNAWWARSRLGPQILDGEDAMEEDLGLFKQ